MEQAFETLQLRIQATRPRSLWQRANLVIESCAHSGVRGQVALIIVQGVLFGGFMLGGHRGGAI
eukprot:14942475-Alexandrium_andersonii.AAC.1